MENYSMKSEAADDCDNAAATQTNFAFVDVNNIKTDTVDEGDNVVKKEHLSTSDNFIHVHELLENKFKCESCSQVACACVKEEINDTEILPSLQKLEKYIKESESDKNVRLIYLDDQSKSQNKIIYKQGQIDNKNFINSSLQKLDKYVKECGPDKNVRFLYLDDQPKHDKLKQSMHKTARRPVYVGKNFECNVCYMSYSKPSALATHYRIHTGEKQYNCNICNKFIRSSQFDRHMQSHTDDVNKNV